MPHNYRSHPSKFRQRDFWLPHEAPGSRHGVTITICSLLFILIVFMYLLISKNDTTEYATRDQVDKIETHLFQLEERLVWTDEKIDTMQAVAEAAAMRVIDEKTVTDSMSKPEMAKESEPEQQVPDESKVTKPPQEKPEVEIAVAKTSPDISSQPKEIPVIQPKIKKKKLNVVIMG
ncbi:MAG: hypothetical protein OMM_02381 [Candidatus Magnetoglobus multicellularis str. Araruama]|uniref:Uncharacterized protein n=1 Tax=Candidatus Magnetoglobus multicellularis str. Araruama TaxID=890399 RepID=A0A1V1P9I6_9BACT|nr:MAG: hypothetical protein OMM_02381 [Candidatus Magnetoglobus multicellularis str. Araruama]